MNIESSFLKDRPPNLEEFEALTEELPRVFFVGEYEDIMRLEYVDPDAHTEKIETPGGHLKKVQSDSWALRMN